MQAPDKSPPARLERQLVAQLDALIERIGNAKRRVERSGGEAGQGQRQHAALDATADAICKIALRLDDRGTALAQDLADALYGDGIQVRREGRDRFTLWDCRDTRAPVLMGQWPTVPSAPPLEVAEAQVGTSLLPASVAVTETRGVSPAKTPLRVATVLFYLDEPMSAPELSNYLHSSAEKTFAGLDGADRWMAREAERWGAPFATTTEILGEPMKIPAHLVLPESSPEPAANSDALPQWIDAPGVVAWLAQRHPDIRAYDRVVLFLHSSRWRPFAQHAFMEHPTLGDNWLAVVQVVRTDDGQLYPEPEQLAASFVHELLHLQGRSVTDKYGVTAQQACRLDAAGQQYDGHDIFCHRVANGEGFINPPLAELKISRATAEELGWVAHQ
jgi:hypothetical protein